MCFFLRNKIHKTTAMDGLCKYTERNRLLSEYSHKQNSIIAMLQNEDLLFRQQIAYAFHYRSLARLIFNY